MPDKILMDATLPDPARGGHPWYRVLPSPGWMIVAAVVLMPAALWLGGVDLGTRFGDPAAALKGLANLSALTGTAAFAATMLLGARFRLVERTLGGFDQLYRIHRTLGYAVLLLLLGHALLVVSSKAVHSLAEGLILFTPAAGWRVFLGVVSLAGLLAMLIFPRLYQLKHEIFVLIHRAIGLMFLLGGFHVLLVPATWSLPPLLIAYLVGLLAVGLLALIYRVVLGRFLVRRSRHRITQINQLGSSVVEIALSPLETVLSYQPGQFIFITIVDNQVPPEAHPFSIVSTPDDLHLRFVVKALGDYTTRLLDLRPGGIALIEGPYGDFSYTNVDNRRQIWIAGGVGVTPFLSMSQSLGNKPYEIDFYYCTQTADESFYLERLFEIADQNPRFRVIPIRKASLGHINAGDIQAVSRDLARQDILMCGPPIQRQFVARGVPPAQIHFEDFSVLSVPTVSTKGDAQRIQKS